MRLRYRGLDPSGLIEFDCDGAVVRNPFELALQATVGAVATLDYLRPEPDLVPRIFPLRFVPDPRGDAQARAAMGWLLAHEVPLGSRPDASVWHYQFDWMFRGERMSAPWVSAFAQAYVVFAGLCWFRHGSDPTHLALAERAARGLAAPIREGGCAFDLGGDAVCFEEIPSAQPTHIFNAHLAALLALRELANVSRDLAHDQAFQRGVRGYQALAGQLDTGFWSTYDCAPRVEAVLQLLPDRDGLALGRVALRQGDHRAELDLGHDDAFAEGVVRAVGIDWGPRTEIDGRVMRGLRHGPSRHAEPVPTGTRQNTYLYLGEAEVSAGDIHLELELRGPAGSSVGLAIRGAPGGWRELADRVQPTVFGCAQATIPPATLRAPVGTAYHRFHILLLHELARVSTHAPFAAKAASLLAQWDRHRTEVLAPARDEVRLRRVTLDVDPGRESKTTLSADLVIQRCLEAGVDELWISIDGTRETHDDIHGQAGLFEFISNALRTNVDAIATAKQRGFRLCVSCAISPLNYHLLGDMVRATAGLPFDLYRLTHLDYVTPEIAGSTAASPEMEAGRVNPFVLYRSLREAEREATALGRSLVSVPALDFLGVMEHYGQPVRPVGKPHGQDGLV